MDVDVTGVEDDPALRAWVSLSASTRAVLLTVARHNGDCWRGMVQQKVERYADVSDRHVRRALTSLQEEGLVDAEGPNKQRETFQLTDEGAAALAAGRDEIDAVLEDREQEG